MAEQPKAPAAPAPAEAALPKKKLPVKTIGVVGIVLVVEAVVIAGAFMLAGRPADVKAEPAAKDAVSVAEQPVEQLVIADKFQNTRTGRTYIYDAEIYITVHRKDAAKVKAQVEDEQAAQISADIALIFRKAEPAYLLEPTLATLTRQIKAALDQRLGTDAEGKSLVQEVLIKKFTQYRADLMQTSSVRVSTPPW